MRFLRQSTASQEILLGPFVATADGSAQTGLTIANTDIKLLKGGATSEGNKNSGGGTHIAGGRYSAVLDATDTDTVGILEVSCNPASGIPWNKSYYVLEEAVYDMLFAASALGYIANAPVNVAQFGGSNGTFASGRPEVNATHWGGTAVASARPLVDVAQISGDSAAADNAEAFFDGTGYAGTNNVIPTVTNVTNLHASAATAAELAKVPKSDGTATWNATALASIQQQAEDALVAHDAPTNTDLDARTLAAASYATAAAQATAQGTLDKLDDTLEDDGGTFRFTANALEEAPAGGGGGGDATEAKQDAIIALIGTPAVDLATDIASRASQSSVDDLPTNAELGTALDPLPTAAEIRAEIDTNSTQLAKLGTPAGASVSADIAAVKAQTAAIETDTQDIQSRIPAALVGGRIDATVDGTGMEAGAVTAIQSGLALAADLATTDGKVDGIKANTDKFANLPVLTAGGTGGQGYGAP